MSSADITRPAAEDASRREEDGEQRSAALRADIRRLSDWIQGEMVAQADGSGDPQRPSSGP